MEIYCERCVRELDRDQAVWLELDSLTGLYHEPERFPADGESQGEFSFGSACAKTVLQRGGLND